MITGGRMANKAQFTFYFERFGVRKENTAHYKIISHADKSLIGSIVTAECLRNGYRTPVPRTPDFKAWKRAVRTRQRCDACWSWVRTKAERDRHLAWLMIDGLQ